MQKLVRAVKRGDTGSDVLAIKRAMKKGGLGKGIVLSGKWGRNFGSALERQVRQLQKKNMLPVDGIYGEKTHKILYPFFDSYGLELMSKAPVISHEEHIYNDLLMRMEQATRETPGYLLGGGHTEPLKDVKYSEKLDCSGSSSKVLWDVGLFLPEWAWVSGTFAHEYGESGTGEFFTVYASAVHVWIRLHKGKYWRFDTSPHGDGGRGPQLRRLPRFTRSFYSRHHKGY